MALPAHHVAFTELDGKFYAFGGFVPPESGPPAWVPINNAWEYNPANDSWKALAPMPSKCGSAVAATVNGKIYVIGGRLGSAFIFTASNTNVVEEYDRPSTPLASGDIQCRRHHRYACGDRLARHPRGRSLMAPGGRGPRGSTFSRRRSVGKNAAPVAGTISNRTLSFLIWRFRMSLFEGGEADCESAPRGIQGAFEQ
ncbi:MAG: kelch repeat-containing protein [Nitrospira sp.]